MQIAVEVGNIYRCTDGVERRVRALDDRFVTYDFYTGPAIGWMELSPTRITHEVKENFERGTRLRELPEGGFVPWT